MSQKVRFLREFYLSEQRKIKVGTEAVLTPVQPKNSFYSSVQLDSGEVYTVITDMLEFYNEGKNLWQSLKDYGVRLWSFIKRLKFW